MGLWENFALGFTYLSPVVGVYSTFAIAFVAGGPPMIWSIVIAGLGQLLVALVFAEIVAQFPVAGGVYPWARRLIGRRWAWITGWIYGWALIATVASVSTGAVPFIGSLFGFTPTRTTTVILAAALALFALAVNLSGTRTLGRVAMAGFVAELIGALVVGVWLLLFERHHDFGALFDTLGTAATAATSAPSWLRRCSACTCSTASRPAATSPRRSPIRAARSRRRCAARSTSAASPAC